ncbi:unnamed protein product, partial [Ixodes pacificus]
MQKIQLRAIFHFPSWCKLFKALGCSHQQKKKHNRPYAKMNSTIWFTVREL